MKEHGTDDEDWSEQDAAGSRQSKTSDLRAPCHLSPLNFECAPPLLSPFFTRWVVTPQLVSARDAQLYYTTGEINLWKETEEQERRDSWKVFPRHAGGGQQLPALRTMKSCDVRFREPVMPRLFIHPPDSPVSHPCLPNTGQHQEVKDIKDAKRLSMIESSWEEGGGRREEERKHNGEWRRSAPALQKAPRHGPFSCSPYAERLCLCLAPVSVALYSCEIHNTPQAVRKRGRRREKGEERKRDGQTGREAEDRKRYQAAGLTVLVRHMAIMTDTHLGAFPGQHRFGYILSTIFLAEHLLAQPAGFSFQLSYRGLTF
ncbi:hypothetical protein EYF80_050187 [Liparis tanakae]|uniref:Uncharacterized protein n=1 Tax=Liparis tanakae TaxID=230148 RepID=A0A4Z2FEJ4_9TELE|nr:hypothetical protein EYF80_050187 [Liparis tanakae]